MIRLAFVLLILVAALVVLRRLTPADVRHVLACENGVRIDLDCYDKP